MLTNGVNKPNYPNTIILRSSTFVTTG